MRVPLLVALLLLPTAAAASQVHVTLVEEGYAVTFASEANASSVPIRWPGGVADAQRVDEDGGDEDQIFRAVLPWDATRYEVEGRVFTLRAPPAKDATVRIAYVADMGVDENASRIVDAIARARPDLIVIGGDLSYANGAFEPWNAWFEMMEPLAASIPTMPAYGNHEDYCQDERGTLRACGPERNEWRAHFALPNGDALYYAFDWGPARFTVLDTEAYVHKEGEHDTAEAEQKAFLDASLDADRERWDVVVFHRPLRTTNLREGAASGAARDDLEPVLAHRANLTLAAHLHAYERYGPIDNVTYVTSGGGGRPLYGDWGPEGDLARARATEHHFLVLEISPTRLEMKAIRPDGSTLDAVTLQKAAPPKPTPKTPTTPIATTPDANASVESPLDTPAPGIVALAVALTLSARLTRPRAPR